MTEAELEEAFREDPEVALELLDEEFRGRIARFIKSKVLGINAADLADLYQSTLLDFVRAVRRPGFDPSRPLRLVFHIAKSRAIDFLRRKRPYDFDADPEAILQLVAADLKGTDLGRRWKYLDPVVWREFRRALHDEILALPERQRQIAVAFVALFEKLQEAPDYRLLARAVSRESGNDENVVTVKSGWHEARRRLMRRLTQRGFDFLGKE